MHTHDRALDTIIQPHTPGVVDRILFDKAIVIIGLLFACNVFGVIGLPGPFMSLIRYGLAAVIFVRLLARYKATLRTLQSDPFLLILNLIVFLSFTWSLNPAVTMTGVRGEYIQAVFISLFLATRFSLPQQVRLISIALGIGALLSAFYVFFVPTVGIHQDYIHPGAWRGVFGHKNYFSAVMALGSASFLVQLIDRKERRPWHIAGLIFCISLIILSTSKTGQILLMAICLVVFGYRQYRWRGMKTILVLYVVFVIIAGAVALLLVAWDPIFTGIGRDPTLSGRTLIWDLLRQVYIPRKFFLGYGRGVFWSTGVFQGLGFTPTHAHNGWYDLIIDVGMIGFFFYLLSAVQAWIRVFRLAYNADYGAYLWPLAFFTVMFINNVTESLMLYLINILWVLYMAVCWSLKEAIIAQKGYRTG